MSIDSHHLGESTPPLPDPERDRTADPAAGEQHGVVAELWPEEGYGIILAESGEELRFTPDDITSSDLGGLDLGAPVEFAEVQDERGPHASGVRPLPEPEP